MKLDDFSKNLNFFDGRHNYRCTDVGTRTINAIVLNKGDERWYVGPPYILPEIVLDEQAMTHCYLSASDAIKQSIQQLNDIKLTYSSDAVKAFLSSRREDDHHAYQNKGVLRHDRVEDGEIYHPYSAGQKDGVWHIKCYLPYAEQFADIDELSFIGYRIAVIQDYRDRYDQASLK